MTGKPLDPDKAAKKLSEELSRGRPGMHPHVNSPLAVARFRQAKIGT